MKLRRVYLFGLNLHSDGARVKTRSRGSVVLAENLKTKAKTRLTPTFKFQKTISGR